MSGLNLPALMSVPETRRRRRERLFLTGATNLNPHAPAVVRHQHWRHALRGTTVPPDTEEHAAGYYERGEYDRAGAIFRLLIECFDNYAEGHNYLGLIALGQGRLDDAVDHFRTTCEVGRKLFPKRISRKSYWRDLATRPYMRGLRNLALSLNRLGRYDEALTVCDRLETECNDEVTAVAIRSSIHLNTGRWQNAADCALQLVQLHSSEGFCAAFAFFELNRPQEALEYFLHAALNYPRAARMLHGQRTKDPSELRGCSSGRSPKAAASIGKRSYIKYCSPFRNHGPTR